jgi:Zn-dependent alcohol dehydrogenase
MNLLLNGRTLRGINEAIEDMKRGRTIKAVLKVSKP